MNGSILGEIDKLVFQATSKAASIQIYTNEIDRLLKAYDNGELSPRELHLTVIASIKQINNMTKELIG